MVNWQQWIRSPYAKAAIVMFPLSIFVGFGYRLYVQYVDLEQSYLEAVEHQIIHESDKDGSSRTEARSRVVPKALTRQQRQALEKERDRLIGQLAKLEAIKRKRFNDVSTIDDESEQKRSQRG